MNFGLRNAELEDKVLARAKNTAYRLLTIRPRSRKELEDRLFQKEYPSDVVTAVIEHCSRLGYLDDAKFASQWAASRIRVNSYGKRRVEQELRQKGISRDVIREALAIAVSYDDEREAAKKAAEKKLRTMLSFEPQTKRRRVAAYLERKGFTGDIIRAILNTV